ncbi:hypothetical protein P8C59_008572 [Phyllachora maydis]|uniref:GPI ethanolamine phosphate transferase 2 n=1 Tax=Phyllachora maydis TaxID=1825666 RepID=A0AAD9IAV5_9PEZI|nr:hypothetical protein P8C59_008572 [Phyllachora maydis]
MLVKRRGPFCGVILKSWQLLFRFKSWIANRTAPFDRLIFMVVDALRSDFVFAADTGFEYTQSLIRNGCAVPFTAHATSPTVTMPRLKAITTGQGFFVADFTEVDNNVTRHVPAELKNDDWNTMVLHFLGLDHIGHKGGPRSSNMLPKQREMDAMVKQIFEAVQAEDHLQSTLFVISGDHGMNDAGNHGGSSAGETSPALVFMSPKFQALRGRQDAPLPEAEDFQYYSVVEQSDLVPTLGALLGFPVPKNNLGALIPEFLSLWSNERDKIQILMRNAHQILDIVTAAFGGALFEAEVAYEDCPSPESEVEELGCQWQGLSNSARKELEDPEWVARMIKWLRKAQQVMSSMASNYDMRRLAIGQVSSFVPFAMITLAYGIMMFASFGRRETISRVGHLASAVLVLAATRLVRGWNQTGQKHAGEPDIVKTFLVERPRVLWLLVSAAYLWIHRKLMHGFDDGLPKLVNVMGSTAVVLAALTFKLAFTLEDTPELVEGIAEPVLAVAPGASLVVRARAVFLGLGVSAACLLYFIFTKTQASLKATPITTLHHLYTLLAMTQSRATNIPLFLLYNVQYHFLESQNLDLVELSMSSLLLQYSSFFASGGTNAISSVDLSSAYNGVADFNVVSVGLLTFISNWAGPIFWTSATTILLLRKNKSSRWATLKGHIAIMTIFTTASIAAVMTACTALRTHLFVWTVFSPKYLYCVAWSLGQHLLVNVGIGGALYWLGTK